MVQIVRRTDVLDDHLIVGLTGDFDLSTVSRVRSAFHEVVRDGWSNVIVDLSNVGFADSAALGVLIGLQRRCREAGGTCVLANPNPEVVRLLTLSGLDTILPIAASIEHGALIEQSNE